MFKLCPESNFLKFIPEKKNFLKLKSDQVYIIFPNIYNSKLR